MINPIVVESLGRRRKFSDEQKSEIIGQALSGNSSIAQVSRENDISQSLIYKWIRDAKNAADFAAASSNSPFIAFEAATNSIVIPERKMISVKIHFPSQVSFEIVGDLNLAKIIALGREFGSKC